MDHVALGHFHNHQAGTQDGVTFAYAGSLVATTFHDLAPRVLLVVELGPDGPAQLHTTPFNHGRRLLEQRVDVLSCRCQEEIVELLQQSADAALLIRFVLSGSVEFVIDARPC